MLRYPGVGNRTKLFTLMILREQGEETVFLKTQGELKPGSKDNLTCAVDGAKSPPAV